MENERARELLAGERQRIEAALANLAAAEDQSAPAREEPGERDSEDLYQQEFDTGLAEDLRTQLAAVERAETRLADGSYGHSIDSGEAIPDQRLEAVPTAERTVAEERASGPR